MLTMSNGGIPKMHMIHLMSFIYGLYLGERNGQDARTNLFVLHHIDACLGSKISEDERIRTSLKRFDLNLHDQIKQRENLESDTKYDMKRHTRYRIKFKQNISQLLLLLC